MDVGDTVESLRKIEWLSAVARVRDLDSLTRANDDPLDPMWTFADGDGTTFCLQTSNGRIAEMRDGAQVGIWYQTEHWLNEMALRARPKLGASAPRDVVKRAAALEDARTIRPLPGFVWYVDIPVAIVVGGIALAPFAIGAWLIWRAFFR